MAESLSEEAWKPLERLPRYEIAAAPRRKPERMKESIVRFKGYENKVLIGEDIAEIDYQPRKCSRPYRLIIVRKNISVQKGGANPLFYICDTTTTFLTRNSRCSVNKSRQASL